jgi:predicted polyphosphate/ATP-dependent NAD kinase
MSSDQAPATSHIHLTEVDEDGHQSDGVGREVLQLEPIVLQQCEEEGG